MYRQEKIGFSVESIMRRGSGVESAEKGGVEASLVNRKTFMRFHFHTNEMKLTKTGRCMFPSPNIQLHNLKPELDYYVTIEFVPADNFLYRYTDGGWSKMRKSNNLHIPKAVMHPKGVMSGASWINFEETLDFRNIRLSNCAHTSRSAKEQNVIPLKTMHKYQPVIRVVECSSRQVSTFVFQECQFIAVTAYQNEKITELKIAENPYAAGFRNEDNKMKTSLTRNKRKSSSSSSEESFAPSKTLKTNGGYEEGKPVSKEKYINKLCKDLLRKTITKRRAEKINKEATPCPSSPFYKHPPPITATSMRSYYYDKPPQPTLPYIYPYYEQRPYGDYNPNHLFQRREQPPVLYAAPNYPAKRLSPPLYQRFSPPSHDEYYDSERSSSSSSSISDEFYRRRVCVSDDRELTGEIDYGNNRRLLGYRECSDSQESVFYDMPPSDTSLSSNDGDNMPTPVAKKPFVC